MSTNGASRLIRDVRDLCDVKQHDLGIDERTVRGWEKEVPSRPRQKTLRELKERLGILESDLADANAGRPPALETFALSHPHRSLLWQLRQSIESGHQLEVIGPPDVLYDQIAECIQAGIESVSRKAVVHIDANQINPTSFESVRNICAKTLGLSQDAQDDDWHFKQEATKKTWVLLLRGADVCCSSYYSNERAAGIISRWCSQLDGIRVPYVLFNTFRVKDFVKYLPGVQSQKEPHLLCYDPNIHCNAWDEWCTKVKATDLSGHLVSPMCHSLLNRSPGLLRFALQERAIGTNLIGTYNRVRQQHGVLKNTVEGLVPKFLREEFSKVMAKVMADNPEPLAGTLEGDLAVMIQNASLRALWERR